MSGTIHVRRVEVFGEEKAVWSDDALAVTHARIAGIIEASVQTRRTVTLAIRRVLGLFGPTRHSSEHKSDSPHRSVAICYS